MCAPSAGTFPFYGKMETAPPAAAHTFRDGGEAVPEESLLFQFRAKPGDPIKIGEATFTIAGALTKMPGEASPAASFAPRVYIPLQDLARTNLLKPGSLARYLNFVKFAPKRRRRGGGEKARAADRAGRARIRHGRETQKGSRRSARQSLPLSQSRRFHFAPSRRGRRGERDPGASATESADGGGVALSRRGRAHDGCGLSACRRWRWASSASSPARRLA